MHQVHAFFIKHHVFITMGVVLLVILIIGFGEYRRFVLVRQINLQNAKFASTTLAFSNNIKNLQDQITSIVAQNNLLNNTVQTQIDQTTAIANQIGQVNNTAATLDKLSKVDPQLLQKYSKIFFLNENYSPPSLVSIPSQFIFDKTINYRVLEGVAPHLEDMIRSAQSNGINLDVASAYRSFGTQAALKSSYNVTYGVGTANSFSADQGYSEHQLGTAVDFTTVETKGDLDLFDGTKAYTWLTSNAYRYGFILSYPKNNAYYVYEPWHWRFVGVDLANRLHNDGKNFYDLDQRVINDYLSIFFD